jgi:hypothetical protein
MRLSFIALIAAALSGTITAWSPEDHEIFRLNDDVQATEGANTTFYSFVGVTKKATNDEISRAYRKKAAKMHPDKARSGFIANYGKGDQNLKTTVKTTPSDREITAFMKKARERFERLSVVANILRGEDRARYDFFLNNGFPKWRGTGYYYQRYRPGAATVLVGLFIVVGGFAHYGALLIGWKRQREYAERFIRDARKLAWGKEQVIPGLDTIDPVAPEGGAASGNGNPSGFGMNRKQKRAQEKETKKNLKKGITADEVEISPPVEAVLVSGPQGSKRRVTAENGKHLIVDSVGNVFLEETDDEGETHEFLVDVS